MVGSECFGIEIQPFNLGYADFHHGPVSKNFLHSVTLDAIKYLWRIFWHNGNLSIKFYLGLVYKVLQKKNHITHIKKEFSYNLCMKESAFFLPFPYMEEQKEETFMPLRMRAVVSRSKKKPPSVLLCLKNCMIMENFQIFTTYVVTRQHKWNIMTS